MSVIPAAPGYWALFLAYLDKEKDGGPLVFEEKLVIGWDFDSDGKVVSVLYGENTNRSLWDEALELPDGRCISADEIFPDRAAWLEASQSNYREYCRENGWE